MRKQIRLLIIDDSPGYSELLKDSSDIWNECYEVLVTHVASASEAVRQIADGDANVVLVDAHLSSSNSLEFVKEFSCSSLPIVVMSEGCSSELEETVKEWGAAGCIPKTADPDDVDIVFSRLAEISADTVQVH